MREIDYRRKVERAFAAAFSDFKRAHASGSKFDFDALGAAANVCVVDYGQDMRLVLWNTQWDHWYGMASAKNASIGGHVELTFLHKEFDLMLPYFVEVTRAVLQQNASLLPVPPAAMSHVGYRIPVTTPSYWARNISGHIYEYTETAWENYIETSNPRRPVRA